MKMNYSKSAGFIETHYSNEFFANYSKDFFKMSEEDLFQQYKEDLATFLSGSHVKNLHDIILGNIEEATGSLFGKNLGIVIIESVDKQDNYAVQLNSDDVTVSPNYVMYNGKPFIIGPYVQHNYKLEFVIHIPTKKKGVSKLRLNFNIRATGEEEGGIGAFQVNEDIFVRTSPVSHESKLDSLHILSYVKGMIRQHLETNEVKPFMKKDVKAFSKLLLEASRIMPDAE